MGDKPTGCCAGQRVCARSWSGRKYTAKTSMATCLGLYGVKAEYAGRRDPYRQGFYRVMYEWPNRGYSRRGRGGQRTKSLRACLCDDCAGFWPCQEAGRGRGAG